VKILKIKDQSHTVNISLSVLGLIAQEHRTFNLLYGVTQI